MQFTTSFIFNFGFNLAGFLLLGVALCHGSWRNYLRSPYELAAALIFVGHIFSSENLTLKIVCALVALALLGYYVMRRKSFKPVDVRDGHNILSMLVGAALFALTVQLHAVAFGVAVFRITG